MGSTIYGDSRGVTPVVGVILLIGITLIGSLGIFIVGLDLIAVQQQQAENERAEQSFIELKQSMHTQSYLSDTSQTIDLDLSDGGAIIRDDAGSISVDSKNLSEEFEEPITFGAIEYEGHNGGIYALEGGAVIRGTGENAQIVSGPRIEYDGATNTLNFQLVEAVGEGELDSDSINLKMNSSEGYSSVVENERVIITIESRYWGAWEQYFINEIGERGVIAEPIEGSDKGKVRVDLGRIDRPTPFENAVQGQTIIDTNNPNAGIEGEVENNSSLEPIDEEIWELVATAEEEYNDIGSLNGDPLEAGEYYADEVDIGDLTVDLEDGDVVLVVNGSLDVGSDFHVKNGEENELQIYTTGDLEIGGGNQMCANLCDESDTDPAALQVYGTSDFQFILKGGTHFEGVIYAPAGEDGSSALIQAGNFNIDGSIVIGEVDINGNTHIRNHPELEILDPAIGDAVQPPEITYLNIAHQQIEVSQD
ncbi:type IV pilin N-terminal domain-containing protein [Halobacteria archaeon AArc-curdl1]|uniref:Type IV pilin N-terminal domain-containing protein n=1 Tax=Natronosalvus hydrolyticus TaxID=2979988 RepID=A0AAP3E6T5_9EURY|nr:type IV pilin N-terminal domain-containing protein [Halobacteria archaeon AArc-curdl1]